MDTLLYKPETKKLAPREIEALQYLAAGLTADEVGRAMGIKVNTARTHIANAIYSLYARNATHAVVLAIKAGWVTFPKE